MVVIWANHSIINNSNGLMRKFTDMKHEHRSLAEYQAPDIVSTMVAVESGFAVTNLYGEENGVTNEDYEWGGTLDGEFE